VNVLAANDACAGAANPEMLPAREARRVTPEALADEAIAAGVEGVSLLGGEPTAQAAGLAALARQRREFATLPTEVERAEARREHDLALAPILRRLDDAERRDDRVISILDEIKTRKK
jgi:pyruvate-formate lyase-activating enzyme